MKKLYLFIIPFVLLCSCGKDEPVAPAPQEPIQKVDTMQYDVTGFRDISLEPTDSVDMQLAAEYISGDKEEISVALISLPKGMSVVFDPHNDTPSFNIDFRFYTNKTKRATYPIQFISSSSAGTRYFKFNITVKPYKIEPLNLIGSYKESGNCVWSGSLDHYATVTQNTTTSNRINIEDLWVTNGGFNVYADLDTANKTLTIPSQVTNGFTFEGTGTYDYSEINIHYRISGTAVNDTCTTILTMQ